MTSRTLAGFPLLLLAAAACSGGHEFEPPDRGVIVAEAEADYSPTMFDTLTWASDSVRVLQGNEVYAETCRRCHGPLGRGNTDYSREQGLTVPSLVEPDWKLASIDSLRRTIFVGHKDGMPVFGERHTTARDIDAVAAYILLQLRPDVMGGNGF